MKKAVGFLMICLISLPFAAAEKSYHLEKGMLLTYLLTLQSRIVANSASEELGVPVDSRYTLRFYVLDVTEEQEAIVAATSHLDKVVLSDSFAREKKASREARELVEKWVETFDPNDSAALILDKRGNILRGSMIWPDSCCYHLPKILEGLSMEPRKGEPFPGAGILGVPGFSGTEEREERTYGIFLAEKNGLRLRLLVDWLDSLPYGIEADYTYLTLKNRASQRLRMDLASLAKGLCPESFRDDENMLEALLRAWSLEGKGSPSRRLIEIAMQSPHPKIRRTASACFWRWGIPQGMDDAVRRGDKDEVVRFNLAKAQFRYGLKKEALERLAREGSTEIRWRSEQVLMAGERTAERREDFANELARLNTLPANSREKDFYERARKLLERKKKVLHFGPRSTSLVSGVWRNRVFRYHVYVPEDYDIEERYPLIIALAGGNGFSEPQFLTMRSLLPVNYILACPDSAYGMWWETDQVRMFEDFMKRIIADYAVDPDRVYLLGFSNGGIAAFHFSFAHPDRFAAVVSLMGYPMHAGGKPGVETEMSKNLMNTPVLIIHGDRDAVIPIELNRAFADSLQRNRLPYHYKEVKGAGHSLTFSSCYDDVMSFLRKKGTRLSAPRLIHLVVDDLEFNRNFWIRVEERIDISQRAHLKAERKGTQFVIETKNIKKLSLLLSDLHYDPDKEYEVIINKKLVFQGRLELDPVVLLESLLQENDYARLYGVKLCFELSR